MPGRKIGKRKVKGKGKKKLKLQFNKLKRNKFKPASSNAKKVPIYKKVTTKKLVKKATPGEAATEGVYQKQLRDARAKDLPDIADDYAARGMIRSGLYGKRVGEYEKDFGEAMAEQNRKKQKAYGDIASEQRSFNTEQQIGKDQARLEAVKRRAARLGQWY